MKPPPHSAAAATPTIRGPTCSRQLPVSAAERPTKTMATEKIQTMELMFQSPAALATTPSSRASTGLKMLHE